MTKKIHPAQGARTFTGAVSALALVGIVTGFQMAANAQPVSVRTAVTGLTVAPTAVPVTPVAATPTATPAPAVTATPVAKSAAKPAAAKAVTKPAAAKPVAKPARAVAPVSGTTAGSGG
jgi:hypothetical protein